MQYTALYREFRPHNFDTIAGQDLIVQTLRNQIKTERISHAYLFCGPRGTGKTSTAKVLAKAVNCANPANGNPCEECQSCLELQADTNMDVLEIDAASNNGVDEIREIRDKIHYPPSVGKFRVYIIDEVHMLSIGAFNALLKTLEEPPAHALFILATTEQQKLPSTILSRCQRYNFKRISATVIAKQLESIASAKGVTIEPSAQGLIAYWAEGGLRDAISLLDQCLTYTDDTVTEDTVLQVLGTANRKFVFNLTDNLMQGDVAGALNKLNELVEEGKDMRVFIKDLTNHLRNVMMARFVPDCTELFSVDKNIAKLYGEQAQKSNQERLLRAVEILTLLEGQLRYTAQPRILMEVAFLKICHPEDEVSLMATNDRITQIENKLNNLSVEDIQDNIATVQENQKTQKIKQESQPSDEQAKPIKNQETKEEPKAIPANNTSDVTKHWKAVVQELKKVNIQLNIMLAKTKLINDGVDTVIVFPEGKEFAAEAIKRNDNLENIKKLLEEKAGHEIRLKVKVGDSAPQETETTQQQQEGASTVSSSQAEESQQKIMDFFAGDDIKINIIEN